MNITDLWEQLSNLEQVEAICLGGSRATGAADEKSDYDVYVYLSYEIPDEVRKNILQEFCSKMEIGNHYWELEDNCTLKNGIDIDIIYRNIADFSSELAHVVLDYNAQNGYTTCMWHNLLTCKIIYDPYYALQKLKENYSIPYPAQLKRNIIDKNMALLSGVLPSYNMQIKKAVERSDFVSINHRITEFIASYFDIIFALNEQTHPGEKRLIEICKKQCNILPADFEKNLLLLYKTMYHHFDMNIIKKIVDNIREVIPPM